MPELRIDHVLPQGVLPSDRWFDLTDDGTCSRCASTVGEDAHKLQIWSGKGTQMMVFCETCLGANHEHGHGLCDRDHGAEPVVRGADHPLDPAASPDNGARGEAAIVAAIAEDTRNYLIWSNEHRSWWGPGFSGYVQVISRAGRYRLTEATVICTNANASLAPTAEPNEVMVLAPEELSVTEIIANSPGLTEETPSD